MSFPAPFVRGNSASITVGRKNIDLISIEFYEDENTNKNYYCWYDKGHVKTFFLNYKLPARKRFMNAFRSKMSDWFPCCYDDDPLVVEFEEEEMKYEDLDWEYDEETGFVKKAIQVLVDVVKRKSVKRLSISAHDVESQRLIYEELQKLERIAVEFLELRIQEDSDFIYKLTELIHHKFYHAEGTDLSTFSVTNDMLGKDFLALHHIISNPEVLKNYTGKSLAIGYGTQNGFDHTFVLTHFKQWLAGNPVQFTFLQVSDGSIPSEEEMQFLHEKAEHVYHIEDREPPAEYVFQFVRSMDGRTAELLVNGNNCAFISDADESKRGFFWNFPTSSNRCPKDGSLKSRTPLK